MGSEGAPKEKDLKDFQKIVDEDIKGTEKGTINRLAPGERKLIESYGI